MVNNLEDQMKERLEETDGNLGQIKNEIMGEIGSLRTILEKAVDQFSMSRSRSGGKKSLELLDKVRSLYRANFKDGEGYDLSKRFIHTTNLEIAASITQAILEQRKFTDEREIKACCRRYYETKKKEEKKLLMDDDEREKVEKYQRLYSRRDRLYKSRNKQVNTLKEQIGPDVFHLWTTTACPELMSDEESDVDNEEVLVRRSSP
ncbi:uncharacterized protein [Clytia hemisphaerica]|uniref:Uncharacterized protein n=1 Tax=Clytia hemisphaerica TaxID=252671 RepID=A0A7M5TU82_9CNID